MQLQVRTGQVVRSRHQTFSLNAPDQLGTQRTTPTWHECRLSKRSGHHFPYDVTAAQLQLQLSQQRVSRLLHTATLLL